MLQLGARGLHSVPDFGSDNSPCRTPNSCGNLDTMFLAVSHGSPSEVDQWQRIKAIVLDNMVSPSSRRSYQSALDEYFAWWAANGRPSFQRSTVAAYRASIQVRNLSPASVNVRLSALRKLAVEAAENALLAPEIANGIARLPGIKQQGIRTGNWLTLSQAQDLLRSPDTTTTKGKRDRAVLALLLGCGLRRSEVAALCVDDIQQRDGRWAIVDILGKGQRVRTVALPAWVKVAIDAWVSSSRTISGKMFRSVLKGNRLGGPLHEKTVWRVLRLYAKRVGLPRVAPHDLRRTCARLCRSAGGDLEQIQFLLGHASIQTTERYLGAHQDLTHAPNDRIRLRL
jgi:integrase/recombinase XerD